MADGTTSDSEFPMKLGFGLYSHQLNRENYRFARQCGASHLVVHLVDYFKSSRGDHRGDQPVGDLEGWGDAGDPDALWQSEDLSRIVSEASEEGLVVGAIENFDPAHWGDILLDGPNREQHLENVKTLIRRVGAAGIPVIGYNFSIAGVAGRVTGPFARGEAVAVGMDGPVDAPMPKGMVWNMWVNRKAPEGSPDPVKPAELWRRLDGFLDEVLPVAEEAGIRLALHPDDPPLPSVRQTPRLVYRPDLYQRVIDRHPSPACALEFCCGTIAEMTEGDLYQALEQYAAQERIAYVHLRNIRGKVPFYKETFIDEGDIDVPRVFQILEAQGFDGMIIPDHAPQMSCAAPWHAGMAFAMGYFKGLADFGKSFPVRTNEDPVSTSGISRGRVQP